MDEKPTKIPLRDAAVLLNISGRQLYADLRSFKIRVKREGARAYLNQADIDKLAELRAARRPGPAPGVSRAAVVESDESALLRELAAALAPVPLWLDRKAARRYTGLGLATINWLLESGRLPAIREHHARGRVLIRRADLDGLAEAVVAGRCPRYQPVLEAPTAPRELPPSEI